MKAIVPKVYEGNGLKVYEGNGSNFRTRCSPQVIELRTKFQSNSYDSFKEELLPVSKGTAAEMIERN